MRTKLIFIFFCCLSAIVLGQNTGGGHKVKGVLLDSISKDPVVYATINIAYKHTPGKAIKMLVTDMKGRFQETLPGAGEYVITLSSVGNQPVARTFKTTEQERTADLGTLYTGESVEELKGVTVVAQKPLVKVEVDKIAYDVASDPDAQDKTVLDMLRKVPLITVDGDDNIKLNGKTNFRIHLNGRPSNLLSNNPGKTLKSMPANSVKDIEVITNPGAKYDAEGVGGIINIITQTGKGLEGYTATFNAGASHYGSWNAGISAMVKAGKFSLSGSYNHSYYRMPGITVNSEIEYYADKINHRLHTETNSKYRQPFDYGSAEASYEIDSLNLLTFTIGSYGGHSNQNINSFNQMQDENGSTVYNYNMSSKNRQNFGGTELSLNYQRTLAKKEELLTLSYRFSRNPSGGTMYRLLTPGVGTLPFPYLEQNNENDAHTNEHTVQVDYVNPFNQMHSLEAGLKFIYRDNYSQSDYEIKNEGEDVWVPYPQDLSNFSHNQYIVSAYAAYSLKFKNVGLKLGARLEQSKLNARLHSDSIADFKSNFTDVVPTVNFSYKLSDSQSLRAGYNIRISRPGIWYLNPYRNETDPHFVSAGNPRLDSEKYHNVEVNYSNFSQRVMINVALSYDFCHNSIQQYNTLEESGKVMTTYANIGKQNNVGLGFYGNFSPFDGTNIWLNGMINHSEISSSDSSLVDARAKGWQFGGSLGFQQKLFWKIELSGYGGYYSRDIQLQGKGINYYYYGLTLRRNFLKDDRLTVSLSAHNFLNRHTTYNYSSYSKDYYQWTKQINDQRNFSLNISYRLGDLRTVVKKVARGIVNDDIKSGGSGTGQQTGK